MYVMLHEIKTKLPEIAQDYQFVQVSSQFPPPCLQNDKTETNQLVTKINKKGSYVNLCKNNPSHRGATNVFRSQLVKTDEGATKIENYLISIISIIENLLRLDLIFKTFKNEKYILQ